MIYGALGEFALGETESLGIQPASIAGAEAFGVPVVVSSVYAVFPTSISGAEAFGVPTVEVVSYAITDAGNIASAEAFGIPSVVLVISPASIASAEAFSTDTIVVEPQVYLPVSRI